MRMRPYAGSRDTRRMLGLVARCPERAVHVLDMPYRLCSPAARSPHDVRLWEDEDGELAAFAVVQRDAFGTLDYVIAPGSESDGREIEDEMLAWALGRFARITAEAGRSLHWWLEAPEGDAARARLAERYGFAPESWHTVHLERLLDDYRIAEPETPRGYVVRPLAGASEVEACAAVHRAAFGSANMTAEWRRATLDVPGYSPALDLVAVAPDGALAGYCIGWIGRGVEADGAQAEAQVEPIGVHPAHQGRGLGRTLLAALLRRMRAAGAAVAHIEATSTNGAVLRLDTSAGFRAVRRIERHYRAFGA